MRRSLILGLLVLACRGGIRAPETTPVAPGVLDSIPPAIAPPAVDTSARTAASAAVVAAGGARTAPDWPLTQRVRSVTGEHAMVVTSHPLASDVGMDVLRSGGNAVDAAVAVAFALAVVHPVAGNIGGGGFMLIRMADGRSKVIDYKETAPALAKPGLFQDPMESHVGYKASAVPGTVAGLAL